MNKPNTVSVNGKLYDPITGMPLAKKATQRPVAAASKPAASAASKPAAKAAPLAAAPAAPRRQTARSVHATAQRSSTLRRTSLKKPDIKPATKATSAPLAAKPATARNTAATKHPEVSKFSRSTGAKPAAKTTSTKNKSADIAPRQHPHTAKAGRLKALKGKRSASATPTAREIKEAEITKAMAAGAPKDKRKKQRRKQSRLMRYGTIAAGALMIIAMLAWLNLPALSVRYANFQSGVDAAYPHFVPEGYRLTLPLDTDNNRVALTFASRQTDESFTLSQEKSSWDSQAVRSMVNDESDGKFLTTQDRGLTIYTYNGNAAWVNKGILYKITGNAQLSSDTIVRITNGL